MNTTYTGIILGIALVLAAVIYMMPSEPKIPQLEEVYWGPGQKPRKIDESIRPFKIKFEKEMIDDLRFRLNNTRNLQPSLEHSGWKYGVNSNYVPTIIDFWLNKYDFRKREDHLNRYPQFLTNIQGLDIHFVRVKPQVPKDRKLRVLPLLIVHGWPGSIVEFQKIIPLLTRPQANRDFVFEVIAPSIPGFGYSSQAAKPGLGAFEMALILKSLMLRLGYDKFYTQGGDWGAVITSYMAVLYPQHMLGMHLNLCMVLNPWTLAKTAIYSLIPWLMLDEERYLSSPLGYQIQTLIAETGYYHMQATKPDTLGIGMTDSPAGFAAYVLEKFSTITQMQNAWTDDGNLLEKFEMTELIDNLMMYWAPNKITSGFRIYAESTSSRILKMRLNNIPVKVPTACAQFPHEIIFQPEALLRDRFVNLVKVTRMKRGGHFAALEEPELLAEDIWSAVPFLMKRSELLRN
ncbi:PREDICTED: juvenile hormone epoxide hydrolase 2-like [Ceratosolen solmsi marchali]|uniref:Epoxide hydrolase n=1 Tax=Ceratosolen solmsi marchali TaxID=326594 RepID=A0AAJ6VMJ0_9HYME|nr:PREDICTED: juvenile hormone epoxide hydrolase 2-like [Ceratosolen solmsi marchali]